MGERRMKVCCDICNLKTNEYKVILTKQLSGVVMCDKCSEDNTKESAEKKTKWLEKMMLENEE